MNDTNKSWLWMTRGASKAHESISGLQDMDLPTRALALAGYWHRDQRYGDQPYIVHCSEVMRVLLQHGWEPHPEIVAAGALHDSIEDCASQGVDERAILDLFPETKAVSTIVQAVTSVNGVNRRQRLLLTLPRVRAAGAPAIAVKLADRIANVRACWKDEDARLFMYRDEHDLLWDALATRATGRHDSRLDLMWHRLASMLGSRRGKVRDRDLATRAVAAHWKQP